MRKVRQNSYNGEKMTGNGKGGTFS